MISWFLAFSIVWWSTQRRREREALYRYEIARMMLEKFPDNQEKTLAWIDEQEAREAQRRRDGVRLIAWILFTMGLGALIGMRFTFKDEALFGWIPLGIGAGMFVYLVSATRTARKD